MEKLLTKHYPNYAMLLYSFNLTRITVRNIFDFRKSINLFFKGIILVLFLLLINIHGSCQLFTQSPVPTNAAGTGAGAPMVGTPGANVIFSSAGKVNPPFGNGNTPCTNGYSGFSVPDAVSSYSSSGPAIEISLSPASGFVLSATGVSSVMRYSATGPKNATYAYSIDGGTTWINNGTIALPQANCQSGSLFSWNFPCSVIVGVSQTFRFRIYFFNASNPSSNGTTQIENLTVNGVAVVCSAPTAAISGTTTICGGGSANITFTGTPSSTVTYNINGGPNQTIALNCLGSAVLNTGVLASTVTCNLVSAGFGSCSQSLSGSAVITVIPPVSSAIISGTATICSGATTDLSVAITGGISPYTLIYSDGSTNTTVNNYISGTNIPVSPVINTTYTLVSVTSVSGCSSLSGSAIITISAKPTAAILSGTTTICNGSSTNLSVAITGGTSPYTVVYFNGVSNTTINNYVSGSGIPVSPSVNTTYTLVSVTSAAGCAGSGFSGSATVTVRPTPTATIGGTITVCQNGASPDLTFTNPQTLPVTITYNINGGAAQILNIGASTAAVVPAATGTSGIFIYNLVSIVYQSAPACSTTITGQSATVTVNSLYSSAILTGNATICNGNNADLSVNITGGVSPYTIVYNDGTSNTTLNSYISGSPIPVSPVANTTYTLISVTGAGGCGGTGIGGTATVTVTSVGTWLGINTNWNDPKNWCDGNIPTSSTNVIIPAAVSFFPVITTVDPKANNITIAAGANINITVTGVFSFAGSVINNGTIANSGTIILNGTTGTQNFPGPGTLAPMANLTINNVSGVNLNKSLNIGGTLNLTNGLFTVGANTLTINNPIAGIPNNLSANANSSITIAGTAAGINLPVSVSQLKNLTVSNSSGTVLQGNLNIATLLFISGTAGTVDADIYTLNGNGNLQMSGGNLYLGKNGVIVPELTGTYTLTGGTVTFNGVGIGTDAQTVRPVNYFNLSSASTGDRILGNTGTIGISNIFIPSTNGYTVTGSTVNFNKTNNQNIPSFGFYNLSLSGGNFTKTLTGDINIRGVLTFAVNTKLSLQNNNVTLKSDGSNTATVASMPTINSISYGTGRFIVERYIPVGSTHIKSWQLLSVPTTTGQTIKDAWQEGATGGPADNPNPGYGTQITSDVAGALGFGFDFYTPTGSTIKVYNSSLAQWQSVASTTLPVANNKGYMLFVRGDRSVTVYNQPAVPTTLRTKGKLFSPGTDAPASIGVAAGKLESIGNPYVSAIDFSSLLTTSPGIDSKYYVWDPLLPGSFGYGGYQTISSVNGYQPVPGGTLNYPGAIPYTKIQPGQGFFVFSTPGGSVSFTENNKIAGNQLIYRTQQPANSNSSIQSIQASLYTGSENLADGNILVFDSLFDNAFDANDAIKLQNFGENFGIKNDSLVFALNARKIPADADTIFYKLNNLSHQGYKFKIFLKNIYSAGRIVYLEDKYTGMQYSLSDNDTTLVDFNINTDPLSNDPYRFFLVFHTLHTVPILFADISAIRNANGSVSINWKVENEIGIDHYEVERANINEQMNAINITLPRMNNGSGVKYNFPDANANEADLFYRIKAMNSNREIYYSKTIKVPAGPGTESISIYPNPVINNRFNIYFHGQPKSEYKIQMINSQGQVFFDHRFNIRNNSVLPVQLDKTIAAGIYYLKITGMTKEYFKKIMIR